MDYDDYKREAEEFIERIGISEKNISTEDAIAWVQLAIGHPDYKTGYRPHIQDWIDNAVNDFKKSEIVEVINPEEAKRILEQFSFFNRTANPNQVEYLASEIKSGRWIYTGDSIKFAQAGYLGDGQHRLMACVRANMPIETLVARGIHGSAFDRVDQGTRRTLSQQVSMMGVEDSPHVSSAAKYILSFRLQKEAEGSKEENSFRDFRKSIKNFQVKEFIKSNMAELSRAKKICAKSGDIHKQYSIQMAVCYEMLSVAPEETVRKFFEGFASGANLPIGSPIIALTKRFTAHNSATKKASKLSAFEMARLLRAAFVNFVEGKSVTNLVGHSEISLPKKRIRQSSENDNGRSPISDVM